MLCVSTHALFKARIGENFKLSVLARRRCALAIKHCKRLDFGGGRQVLGRVLIATASDL